MPITEPIYPWPTLKEFLDADGDLWSLHTFSDFKDALYGGDGVLLSDADRLRTAELSRHLLAQSWSEPPTHDRTAAQHLEHCRWLSWEADLLSDPAIRERVRASLIPEQRADGERERDLWRRPYPLSIGVPALSSCDGWNCDGCGKRSSWGTEAICVGYREGHSRLDDDISYCRECIELVLKAYDVG